MPTPNIHHPIHKCGIYNPNTDVRDAAARAIGKLQSVGRFEMVEKYKEAKKAFVVGGGPSFAEPSVTEGLTAEERAGVDEMVDEEKGRRMRAREEEDEIEKKGERKEKEEDEREREEKEKEKEKEKEDEGKEPQATRAPAPLGLAHFLQRGKEIDRRLGSP